MPMKNPPHPGSFIRTEIIEPAGLSVTAAASALKVSRPALSSLLTAPRKSPSSILVMPVCRLVSGDSRRHPPASANAAIAIHGTAKDIHL